MREGFAQIFILFIVLALTFIGAGYFYLTKLKSTPEVATVKQNPSSSESTSSNTTITSVSDALNMNSGTGIKCTRIKENSNTPPGVAYIKDGKIKFEGGNKGLALQQIASGLSTNDTLWIWVPGAKEGQKFSVGSNYKDLNTVAVATGLDEYKQDCIYAELDDSFFKIPDNISFASY